MFACFLYAYFPIVWMIYPETTQRTLEDMDVIFRTNPSVFVFRNKNLTQRARPQAFIDAETARIEEGTNQLKRGISEGSQKSGVASQQYLEKA